MVTNKVPLEKFEGLEEFKKEIENLNIRHLFRYSGTENKLRLLLEGGDKKQLEPLMQRAVEFFKKALS
jgi:phosphoglucosamine mutase